ncbi:MAG: hypothetical protein IT546_14055 [Caulobacteraceae bacterium]|nr:hypothetical protein [Caulobacteraceae bacterium]
MTSTEPPSPPRPPSHLREVRLSPRGRQKFGEWLANRLVVAAGGIAALILAPSIVGPQRPPDLLIYALLVVIAAFAAMAILVHYMTAERFGETAGPAGNDDG